MVKLVKKRVKSKVGCLHRVSQTFRPGKLSFRFGASDCPLNGSKGGRVSSIRQIWTARRGDIAFPAQPLVGLEMPTMQFAIQETNGSLGRGVGPESAGAQAEPMGAFSLRSVSRPEIPEKSARPLVAQLADRVS
jgi:hypothetical protein